MEEGDTGTIRTPLSEPSTIYDDPMHHRGLGKSNDGFTDFLRRWRFDHLLTLGVYDLKGYNPDDKEDPPMRYKQKHSPFFWLFFAFKGFMITMGYIFHKTIGQGGPVRPDETLTEKKVRFQAMYTMSGTLMINLIISIVQLVKGVTKGNATFTGEGLFNAALWSVMLSGNAYGYRAMTDQSNQRIKLWIAGFVSLTTVLCIYFILQVFLYYFGVESSDKTDMQTTTVITRTMFCMANAVFTYSYITLWDFYPRATGVEPGLNSQKAAVIGAAIFLIFCLGTTVVQDYVWDSL